jgi:anti-sigma regulatory factor (Ser/Thr protein kinase)
MDSSSQTAERFKIRALAVADELPRVRQRVAEYAQTIGASEDVVERARLAASEALTNIIVHAYLGRDPGSMVVEAWCEADHLVIRVSDDGHGLIPRSDSPGLGVGIPIMARVTDDFRVANREAMPGTVVSLRFSLR